MDYIVDLCKHFNIKNFNIIENTIDVDGDVNLYDKSLFKIPLNFGKVTGNFSCAFNNLTSLEGCPRWIGGNFYCHGNNLESIEGPEFVGGDFLIDKSIVEKIDKRYKIENTLDFPSIKNYNEVNKLIKRKGKINSILKNNI